MLAAQIEEESNEYHLIPPLDHIMPRGFPGVEVCACNFSAWRTGQGKCSKSEVIWATWWNKQLPLQPAPHPEPHGSPQNQSSKIYFNAYAINKYITISWQNCLLLNFTLKCWLCRWCLVKVLFAFLNTHCELGVVAMPWEAEGGRYLWLRNSRPGWEIWYC